jgi:hypothetical protein
MDNHSASGHASLEICVDAVEAERTEREKGAGLRDDVLEMVGLDRGESELQELASARFRTCKSDEAHLPGTDHVFDRFSGERIYII